MSTPIVEQIAENLVTLIGQITVANGFNQTLTPVRPKRIHLESNLNTDGRVIIAQTSGEASVDANETLHWRERFEIQIEAIDSDDATEPIDNRLNILAADVIKQLFTDQNYTLGGLADGIVLEGTQRFLDDPQIAGVSVNIHVLFPFDTANPYSQT